MKVGHQILRNRKAQPGHENRRPDLDHPAKAGKGPDEPEGHQDREERQLPADHPRELLQVEPADCRQRDHRRTQCAIGHRRSVGDQRQPGRGERREAQADENRGGHRNRRTETRGAFEEGAEAKRNQQQLQAPVVGDVGDAVLQYLE